jgi:hypothetical protein
VTAVLTLPPATADAAGPRSRRRDRGRRATAVLAVVLLVGGLVWSALLWAPSTAEVAAGTTRFAGSAAVVTVPEYGLRGTHIVPYDGGAELSITVPVRNDGPLPLTVTSAATGSGVLPLLEVRAVDGLPLALAPGQEGEVLLHAVLANCGYYHEREVQNLHGLVLGVDVGVGPLSRATTLTVPLDRPILVKSPMIVKCQERKINRQANNRSDAL